jgi:hypothetical protein
LVERRKNKNHDELDGDKLISATSRFDRNCSVSETTPFAEISFGVQRQTLAGKPTDGFV